MLNIIKVPLAFLQTLGTGLNHFKYDNQLTFEGGCSKITPVASHSQYKNIEKIFQPLCLIHHSTI